jgi:predicted kinase
MSQAAGPELVLFIGLQASGKSTFYRTRFAATHAHVSKDRFRHNRNRDRRQRQLIEESLRQGQSVVVDNTNPTAEERQNLIDLARVHGARVVGYYFESRVRDCLERNRGRQGSERVEDVAIFATIKRLQPPSRREGFDQLFHVRLAESGFEVSDWREEETDETERL